MGVLTYASAFTNDMLAVYATYFIAKTLSEKYDLKGSQPAVTALVVFFILCAVVKDGQLNTYLQVLLQPYLQLKFITFVTSVNGILKCQRVYHQWCKIALQP